jgi:hypothetical protein
MRRNLTAVIVLIALLIPVLPASAAQSGPVYLALGDTQGYGIGVQRPDQLCYVAVLHRWLHGVKRRTEQPEDALISS